MGLEIALLVSGLLLFAGIAFYTLRGQARPLRPSRLNPEPTLEDEDPATKPESRVTREQPAKPTVAVEESGPAVGTIQTVVAERSVGKTVDVDGKAGPGVETPEAGGVAKKVIPRVRVKTRTGVGAKQPPAAPAETETPTAPAAEGSGDVKPADEAAPMNSGKLRNSAGESELEIDFVARIKIGRAVIRDEILGIYRQHEYQFGKPSKIFGLNDQTGLWCDLELELDSAGFTQVGASIQLADKNGAITEDELNRFSQMMLTLADSLNRPFRFSMEFEEALERAEHLDQLGRRYDAMAVLNIVARHRDGFRSTDIESCARDLQMYKNLNGVYVRADTRGAGSEQALYRMAPADERGQLIGDRATDANVKDLVLYMNVPVTRDPEQVFHRMMEDARSLAEWLDGKIIDQHGRHMTARGFKQITRQIRDISQDMRKDGLRPGDTVSARLF
jgi:hypothetical protein